MKEQTFGQMVRESRLFYRRRLTEKLMLTGVSPGQAVRYADEALQALRLLEQAEGCDADLVPTAVMTPETAPLPHQHRFDRLDPLSDTWRCACGAVYQNIGPPVKDPS